MPTRIRVVLFGQALLAHALLIAASSAASAAVLRFQTVERGDVAVVGNTLGLSKAAGVNSPGASDSIGTFITTNALSVDNAPTSSPSWPGGTTNSWPFDASTGVLSLPPDSTVLYAELVWGGSTNYVEDVTASLDVAVGLGGPGGACGSISPDPATAETIAQPTSSGFTANYYLRSADVTSCVAAQGAGTYTVSGVPATQHEAVDTLNAAGWVILVAYHNDTRPLRNLSIHTDGSFVDELAPSDLTVSGLSTPGSGPVEGRIVAAAVEGDANKLGDQLRIRPGGGAFVALSGSRNPATNFFGSQVNDADGNLDIQGSFGMENHDVVSGTNVIGARQGLDTTGIVLSSAAGHLTNAQTTAEIQASTSGDSFVFLGFGLAVDEEDESAPAVPGLTPFGTLLLAIGLAVAGASRARVRLPST